LAKVPQLLTALFGLNITAFNESVMGQALLNTISYSGAIPDDDGFLRYNGQYLSKMTKVQYFLQDQCPVMHFTRRPQLEGWGGIAVATVQAQWSGTQVPVALSQVFPDASAIFSPKTIFRQNMIPIKRTIAILKLVRLPGYWNFSASEPFVPLGSQLWYLFWVDVKSESLTGLGSERRKLGNWNHPSAGQGHSQRIT
jgi:hypothetical protein